VPEVRRGGHGFGGEDDVLLVADGLRVVALNAAAHPVHELGVRVGDIDLALRRVRGRERVRRPAETPPVLHLPARSVGLVARVGLALDVKLFLQRPAGFEQPFAARVCLDS